MLRNANIRTRERDSTHSRMPSKLPAPVLPPSTHVVTPVERATSSVRGPKSAAPAKQCACKSMSPGRTSRPVTSSTVSPSGASPARTSVTRPSRTRTSSAPASPAPGSTTCPPRSSTPITRLRPWPGKDPVRSGGVSLPEGVLLSEGSPLLAALSALARDARCVFFAGLPGTGKSLLIDHAAEPLLASPATRFVIPVPSPSLRRHLEAERARRASAPVHAREREDAPPDVLRGVWRELVGVARALGISDAADDAAYDPAIYRSLYERLLTHRHAQALAIDERLPAGGVSAYEFRIPTADLVPSDADVARFIAEAEKRYPDPAALGREIEGWFAL